MPNLKGMNVEALMKLRNQVDERLLFVANRARRGNCPRDHRLLAALDQLMMGLDISKSIRRDLGRKRSKA